MVIVGVGLDAVELARMRTSLHRTPSLATRTFTDDEREYCEQRRDPTERFAARFAAKEAVLKVLGKGILEIPLRDIEVVRAATGKPSVRLHGKAAVVAAEQGITTWHLSLTHTETMAHAVAVGIAGDHEPTPATEWLRDERGLLPDPVYFAGLDRKRNAAGALLWDERGRLLIVKPNYRDFWGLPGGAVDAGESPRQACAREVLEEIGLHRPIGRLRLIEWKPPAAETLFHGEAMLYLFDGGVLSEPELATIRLQDTEIEAWELVEPGEAIVRAGPASAARRLAAVLAAPPDELVWIDDGVVVPWGGGAPAP